MKIATLHQLRSFTDPDVMQQARGDVATVRGLSGLSRVEQRCEAKIHGRPLPDLGPAIPDYAIERKDNGVVAVAFPWCRQPIDFPSETAAQEYIAAKQGEHVEQHRMPRRMIDVLDFPLAESDR